MSDYPVGAPAGIPPKLITDMQDGTFAERQIAHPPFDLLTDGGTGPARRLRVDPGQTGFFAGRFFRSYIEAVIDKGGLTPLYARFTSPIDFILWSQVLTLTQGAIRFQAFTGVTFSGAWTQRPVIGVNRMAERPLYDGSYYAPQCTLETGGSFTGGTEVDLLMVRTASTNGQASNTGQTQSERGLPAGQFGLKFSILTGGLAVNDNAQMLYALEWEERP